MEHILKYEESLAGKELFAGNVVHAHFLFQMLTFFPTVLLLRFRLRGKRRHLGPPGGLHHHSLPVQQDPSAADDQARHDHAALPDHQVQREQKDIFKEQ